MPKTEHPLSIQREELKGKLRTSLESNIGNLTEEELSFIHELSKITPDPEPTKNLEMVKGGFRLLNSTMPNVLYRGARITFGRATFSMVRPLTRYFPHLSSVLERADQSSKIQLSLCLKAYDA